MSAGLTIHPIVSAPFDENSYVVHDPTGRGAFVVDPGFDPDSIVEYLERTGLTLAAILNTHGHADHIAGNELLLRVYPHAPLLIGAGDAHMLTDAQSNLSAPFGFPVQSPPATHLVRDGDAIELLRREWKVFEIPGHSPGHVVFAWLGGTPPVVFGGDVLFAGGIGRTDFPNGSFADLLTGIRSKLYTLPDDSLVYPGHGPPTTVGREKRSNPFTRE